MRFQYNLSVLHYTSVEGDANYALHRQIDEELAAGRNVMLVCDSPIVRRVMRMAFGSLAFRNQPGRFAIVTADTQEFAEMIPPALVERMHIFPNPDDAVDWLVPDAGNANETLVYACIN
jgi:hypothetical protein